MNYQEMSDHEISCEVGSRISLADYLMAVNCQRDYCNSWADAGPIIQENGISLYHSSGNWEAEIEYSAPVGAFGTDETCSKFISDKNPLRAAMVVFLMMKGGE